MNPSPLTPNRRHFLGQAFTGVGAMWSSSAMASSLEEASERQSGVQEAARWTDLAEDVDVVVCGAGPAGVTAAVQAARLGAKVRLLEVHGCLGGVWTAGLLSYVLDAKNHGFTRELVQVLDSRGAFNRNTDKAFFYDPEDMKVLLEEKCLEAGVKVQLFTRVVAAIKDKDQRLTTVITESKSGRQAWKAKVFIDATGDGDLGHLAGCQWELGESQDCPCQPMTMMAMVTVPDPALLQPFASHYGHPSWRKEPVENFRAELAKFGHQATYGLPSLFHIRDGLFNLMINHEYAVRADDTQAITDATFRARGEIHKIVRGLKGLGGPWKDLMLVATAEQIGVRDGRRIQGRYVMSSDDLLVGKRHEDGVTLVEFPVDIHATTQKENEKQAYHNANVKSKPYEIPLRALIAKQVDGLMMAGRCISGDFISHASYRVTGNAVTMGEAVGKVAAYAVEQQRLPHQVTWKEASTWADRKLEAKA